MKKHFGVLVVFSFLLAVNVQGEEIKIILPPGMYQPIIIAYCDQTEGDQEGISYKNFLDLSEENQGRSLMDNIQAELKKRGCRDIKIIIDEKK